MTYYISFYNYIMLQIQLFFLLSLSFYCFRKYVCFDSSLSNLFFKKPHKLFISKKPDKGRRARNPEKIPKKTQKKIKISKKKSKNPKKTHQKIKKSKNQNFKKWGSKQTLIKHYYLSIAATFTYFFFDF